MASSGEDFSQFDLSKEEKDKLVAEVIRYVLFKTHQNSGCPIKREELTQLVTENYLQRALPSLVINEAKEKLSDIFGYLLRELQRSRPSAKNRGVLPSKVSNCHPKIYDSVCLFLEEAWGLRRQTALSNQIFVSVITKSIADAKSYVLMSNLPADVYRKYVEDVNTAHRTGFTFVILSIVHLAGGKLPEGNLWHHLRRMGLSDSDEIHPVLGNVRQALEALVQQRYLHKVKVNGPEGNTLFYELAERALDEPVNGRIKEYVSQIVKKDAVTVGVY